MRISFPGGLRVSGDDGEGEYKFEFPTGTEIDDSHNLKKWDNVNYVFFTFDWEGRSLEIEDSFVEILEDGEFEEQEL